MVSAKYFLNKLIENNIQFFSGVPCSYLTPLINEITHESGDFSALPQYIPASSEGDALAMASGAWLSGKMSAVMCQNSGLGNMVNPLTSLNTPFQIPVLLLITWRGYPGEKDEPQHELMGKITPQLLDLMQIPWSFFPVTEKEIEMVLNKALDYMNIFQMPYALLLKKNSFLEQKKLLPNKTNYPRREEALKRILDIIPETFPIIATTGKTGRELYTLKDRANHLYCVGSMGYANALGHGIALNTTKKVIIIDGDGAAIMHLGNLVSIGATATPNLVHIVLDNHAYDSTGAQPTVSKKIHFSKIAEGAGYKKIYNCSSLMELDSAIRESLIDSTKEPVFIHCLIQTGSMEKLGRPAKLPKEVARRLRNTLCQI